MQWTDQYTLFLFDFDGLLVDTEQLHHTAYVSMCAQRGYRLDWDFETYLAHAHRSATALKEGIYRKFPQLYHEEPNWNVLYEEKRRAFLELLDTESVPLMPGAAPLLSHLLQQRKQCTVVTHSGLPLVEKIKRRHPLLQAIPHWITREQYTLPKPDPECYRYAIEQLANPDDPVVGFEDSLRGLTALLGTRATPVWICATAAEQTDCSQEPFTRVFCYPSLDAIDADHAPHP